MSWNNYSGSTAYRDWLHERIWEYEEPSCYDWQEHIKGTDLEEEYHTAQFAYHLHIARDLECVIDSSPLPITQIQL